MRDLLEVKSKLWSTLLLMKLLLSRTLRVRSLNVEFPFYEVLYFLKLCFMILENIFYASASLFNSIFPSINPSPI